MRTSVNPVHAANGARALSAWLSAVAVGEVGIIFSLEVSRISRGNRNGYHLLDICAITHTLIADAEGLYDSRAPTMTGCCSA